MRSAAIAAITSLLVAGCPAAESGTTGSPPPGSNLDGPIAPNTSIPRDTSQPDVTATGPQGMLFDSSGKLVSVEPVPAPTAMRADRPLQAESPAREDQPGVTVEGEFKMRGLGVAPKVPEVSSAAIAIEIGRRGLDPPPSRG